MIVPHFGLTTPTRQCLKQSRTTQPRENTLTATDERQSTQSKCSFHNNAEHWTSECKSYLSESVDGRKRMLMEKGTCWSCLKRGHRIHDCKRKRNCGINDCSGKHHRTIHEERKEVTASANICSNSQIDTSPTTSKNKTKERTRKCHVGQRGFHITHHKPKGTDPECFVVHGPLTPSVSNTRLSQLQFIQ